MFFFLLIFPWNIRCGENRKYLSVYPTYTELSLSVLQIQKGVPKYVINSFPSSGDFSHLLITNENTLDPDQAQQNVGPDLDPNCLTL